MTTITATPNASTGAVDLLISQTSVVTQVLRSNAYGVQQLRTQTGQFPTAASGTTVLTDYENSNGVNTYTASCTDTTVRTNLCTNPSFETDANGWSGPNGSTVAVSNAQAYLGSQSLLVTMAADPPGNVGAGYAITLNAGVTYTVSAYVYIPAGSDPVEMSAQGAGGLFVVGASSTQIGQWERVSLTFTAPSGAGESSIYVLNATTAAAGQTFYVDAVLIEESSTLNPYFDGSTSGDSDNVYAWTGAANASTSTYTHYTRSVSTTATVDLGSPWLLCPIAPNYSESADSVTNYTSSRSTNSTVHQIIGRADPIVVMGKLGTRSGKLEVFASSVSDAERLSRVFSRGETVLLKQPVDQMDMYFIPSNVAVDPYVVDAPDTTMFKLTLDFTETARPYGDLAGALGWNYDALASAYANYDAVTAAFASFDDLTLDSTS